MRKLTSIHLLTSCYPPTRGLPHRSLSGRLNYTVNRYSIQNGLERRGVFYWYQSKDRLIANEYAGKLFLLRDAFFRGHTAASFVRIVLPDDPAVDEDGLGFAARLIPHIRRCFGE